jgi:hypothetical protein
MQPPQLKPLEVYVPPLVALLVLLAEPLVLH